MSIGQTRGLLDQTHNKVKTQYGNEYKAKEIVSSLTDYRKVLSSDLTHWRWVRMAAPAPCRFLSAIA